MERGESKRRISTIGAAHDTTGEEELGSGVVHRLQSIHKVNITCSK